MGPTPICDQPARHDERVAVRLPGGFVDEAGEAHRDVELASLTGRDEEALALVPRDLPVAAFVTHLLRICVTRLGSLGAVTTAITRQMLVADRDWLVRQIRTLTHGRSMWIQLACPSPECGKTMDVDLPIDRLPFSSLEASSRYLPLALDDGRTFEFRLPTGEDQEAVAAFVSDPAAARAALARRCLRGAALQIDEGVIAALEARMEQQAPDTDVEVDATCPECGCAFARRVDVVWLIVSELRAGARRVAPDVHRLASAYHWAERDILDMSRIRRQRYLALIAES